MIRIIWNLACPAMSSTNLAHKANSSDVVMYSLEAVLEEALHPSLFCKGVDNPSSPLSDTDHFHKSMHYVKEWLLCR